MQQEGMIWDKSPLFEWWMHVLPYVQLKRADASMLRSYRAALNQMSSWVAVLLTCMPNVGVLTMLRECSARCPHVMWFPCNAMLLGHVKCGNGS
jgi:hypothetical protein